MNNIAEVQLTYNTKVKPSAREKISDSKDCVDLLKPFYKDVLEYREQVSCLLLNRSNKILGHFIVSLGGISGTVADVRIILQAFLLSNASGLILCHNHPSGNIQPSEQDIALTRKIKEALLMIEGKLLDHVIITKESHFSFADEGIL